MEGNARWASPTFGTVVQTAVKLVLGRSSKRTSKLTRTASVRAGPAHDALDAIHEALAAGMGWVIDADITAYFDTIPHDRLMKTVAQRVVDGAMRSRW